MVGWRGPGRGVKVGEGRRGQEELKKARECWRESESVGEVQGVLERARASEGCGGTGSVTEGMGELERAKEGYRRPGRVEEVRGVLK